MSSEVKVGKYTLESLTTGMYNDPKILYREYIQNSVDSLEEAVRCGLINEDEMKIEIITDKDTEFISIYDNGMGIKQDDVFRILTSIGNSQKRYSNNRGFRGIGRLGGLSYCEKLRFITSYKGENVKSIIEYDCKRLKELLIPGAYENYDLSKVINEVTNYKIEKEQNSEHYFIVEMDEVKSFSDLLEIDRVKSYIRQVAPIPYKKNFIWKSKIKELFQANNVILTEFPIYVGYSDSSLSLIYKSNNDKFHVNTKRKGEIGNDEIRNIETFTIRNDNEKIIAIGWYSICNFYGGITDKEISGLRVRKGNILIGDNKLLNNIFNETRFNNWTQGEVFIISDDIIPNARRDDFEENSYYFKLFDELKIKVGKPLTKIIRTASRARNNSTELEKKISEAKKVTDEVKKITEKGFNSKVEKNTYVEEITKAKEEVEKVKPRNQEEAKTKEKVIEKIEITIDKVVNEGKFKTDKIKSINRKERKILHTITDIISEYITDKEILDDIIEKISKELSKEGK